MLDAIRRGLACLGVMLVVAAPAIAHETDNYTVLPGRSMADLGPTLDTYFHERMVQAVDEMNSRIRAAVDAGESVDPAVYDPAEIARAVHRALPGAYALIEGVGRRSDGGEWDERFPGQVAGHKALFAHVYQGVHLPIDPRQFFKVWFAPTIKAHGVYLGTDKLGHFVGMGIRYANAYYKALADGATEAEAMAAARKLGTDDPLLSESGLLGYVSAGAYSNADLASNYAGLLFYRNLTEPITAADGRALPPMLERDGPYWKLAGHVTNAQGLLEPFITAHWDEALNPSLFERPMRGGMLGSIRQRSAGLLWRHRTAWGAHRPPRYFDQLARTLSSYGGRDYGHDGTLDELITIAVCFEPPKKRSGRNDAGYTPLHLATIKGETAAARRLIDDGADVNAMLMCSPWDEVEYGATPLHLAAEHGHAATARLLIDAGARVDRPSGSGIRPIHRATDASMLELLVGAGADPALRDDAGRTALHHAAMRDAAPVMTALLDDHALDRDAVDHRRRTPLHAAVGAGMTAAAEWLIERGAAIDAPAKLGRTPLHLAVERGDRAMARLLLEAGAAVDPADALGLTPLHLAVLADRPRAVAMLAEAGASLEAADRFGQTPLDLARRKRGACFDALARRQAGPTPETGGMP